MRKAVGCGCAAVAASTLFVVVAVVGVLAAPLDWLTGIVEGLLGGRAMTADLRDAGFRNGRLPSTVLVEVPTAPEYRCLLEVGAAEAWNEMVLVADMDGITLVGAWCYRSYDTQVATYVRNCGSPSAPSSACDPPTAQPGNSNHGWGRAVDVVTTDGRILGCSDDEFKWLQDYGPLFGWVHPAWAHCGEPKQEAWHWEWAGPVETEWLTTVPNPEPPA